MLKYALLFISVCALASPVMADPVAYNLVKEKSYLKFVATMNNAPIEGKFAEYSADIRFDREHPENSSIEADVDTGSVSVSNPDVQKDIGLPEWLGAEKFPKAHLSCKKLRNMPQTQGYYGECKFTLRDKTVPVVINFQLTRFEDDIAIANGYITLHRLDYGVGQGDWAHDDVVKDQVRVEFRIFAKKK